jgi:hypothetical protein
MAIAAMVSAGAVFAFQASDRPAPPSAATGSILGDMDGLDPLMARAEARGPYSLSCNSAHDESLACSAVADKDVIPALKRGETIYGRTVIGFPGGAKAGENEGPTFEASDLICAAAAGALMTCRSVTAFTPTAHAGQRTLSFYKRHNVTFNDRGRTVGHLLAPTIPLQVLP